MKQSEQLSTVECMDITAIQLRELHNLQPGDRNALFHINKAKATAMLIKQALSIAVYDQKMKSIIDSEKLIGTVGKEVKKGKIKLLK
jgi:hypothetical protein